MHLKFCLAIVSILILAASATAQAPNGDPADSFYDLTKAAPRAFNAGEHENAAALANQLLAEAEHWKTNWNYGNAIHAANLVLGRIALAKGETEDARKFLLAAGKTPGSPQLKSFGPDMLFATEMLKKGETKAVLEYFELCAKFWERKDDRLDVWKAAILRGETPDFGPNVRYFF